MRLLVTGSRSKVGRAVVRVLLGAGHVVTGTDLTPGDLDRQPEGTAPYLVANLTDAGQVYALVGGVTEGANDKSDRTTRWCTPALYRRRAGMHRTSSSAIA